MASGPLGVAPVPGPCRFWTRVATEDAAAWPASSAVVNSVFSQDSVDALDSVGEWMLGDPMYVLVVPPVGGAAVAG